MEMSNGFGHANAAHAADTGELKSSSPDGLGAHTPAGAGDLTPTATRTRSPFNILALKSALSSTTPATTNEESADHPKSEEDTEHTHAHPSSSDSSDVYDSLHLSSLNTAYPSRSLTPKNYPAAQLSAVASADGPPPDHEDMPNNSPRPGADSGPPRSAASRRQQQQQQQHHVQQHQQQRGLPPYGYYASPSASESGFSRNPSSLSGQGAPPSFAHTHAQQPSTPQRSAGGYVGQYTMSPSPAPMYSSQQQQQPHQYAYPPQLSLPGHAMPPLTHSHSSQDFFSVSQSQAPVYTPSFAPPAIHTSAPPEHASALSYDYDGSGSAGRSPAAGGSSPYTPQQPFQQFYNHPTLTATPQFTHTQSFSSPFQQQHAQRPQYPPSYGYITAASPTLPDEAQQQQQAHAQWWYIPPPHSASPNARPYNMYYLDAYGNPSNPGMGFPSGSSASSSRAMQPSSFSSLDVGTGPSSASGSGVGLGPAFGVGQGGPQRSADDSGRPESASSSAYGPLSPSSVALGESVSERGVHQPQQMQLQAQSKHSSRRSMLPNPPAHRSEWVMWVGNVPSDATHDELWRFFARPITPIGTSPAEARAPYHQQLQQPPHLPAGLLSPSGSSSTSDATPVGATGVASVFLIARSNCAFVNFSSAAHLSAAVTRFNGIPLRPGDPRCPRLVCRVRGKDEDQRAGVGGQRGMGMHTRWIREQRERGQAREQDGKKAGRREGSTSEPPDTPSSAGHGMSGAESTHEAPHHGIRRPPHHSSSSGSTTSGFLARHFPKRYFILKSLTQYDLDLSVEKGVWATQPHNETVLNQAFRTSSDVFLVFSVNKSGEFFGYAKMASPIGKSAEDRVSWASRTDSQHSASPAMSFASSVARTSQVGETIKEENENSSPEAKERDLKAERDLEKSIERERRPVMLFSPGEHRAEDSPQPVSQFEEKRLQINENENDGKKSADRSGEASTAPPSDRHLEKQRDSLPGRGGRPALRPNSPTSAPAIMGQPHRRITNPLVEGLASETMDPRMLRHRLPSVDLDPVAPLRAVRDHDDSMRAVREQEERGASEEQAVVDEDHVKRKDTFNKSKSGSSGGSKFRGVSQAEPIRPPGSPTSGPEETMVGPSLQSQITADAQPGVEAPAQWGTPFKVQWVRVGRLPFHRTRHLRNPWNHEREVKVSRDGTELEPGVGQALLDEWDKEEPPPSATPAGGGGPGGGPASPVTGRRGFQNRRQSQVPALSLDGEASPAPNSPRESQQKQRPR